jgi:hypothetical protein
MVEIGIWDEYRGRSKGTVRVLVVDVKGRWGLLPDSRPKAGVKGVRGVLGVDMYLPLHFGQRKGFSDDEVDTG